MKKKMISADIYKNGLVLSKGTEKGMKRLERLDAKTERRRTSGLSTGEQWGKAAR